MLAQIEAVLWERVRPQLALHKGDIRVLDIQDGVLRFELLGRCSGCPAASLTTEQLIRSELTDAIPELRDVVLIQQIDESLLAQAKSILSKHRP